MNRKKIIVFVAVSLLLLAMLASCGGKGQTTTTQRELTFAEYIALPEQEQIAYYNTFASKDDFFAWYNRARAAYDATATSSTVTTETPPQVSGGVGEGDRLPEPPASEITSSSTTSTTTQTPPTQTTTPPTTTAVTTQTPPTQTTTPPTTTTVTTQTPPTQTTTPPTTTTVTTQTPPTQTTTPPITTTMTTQTPPAPPTPPALPTYEEYLAMTPEEQLLFMQSFDPQTEFFAWYNAAKQKYDEEHNGDEIGEGGNIDLGGQS